MERCLQQMGAVFPGAAVGLPMFSEECAHQLLAAADYVLVPSRFEPCGLVALQGQRYGAVPIVASVGGLTEVVTCKVSNSDVLLSVALLISLMVLQCTAW